MGKRWSSDPTEETLDKKLRQCIVPHADRVYFQAPSAKRSYPCIIYNFNGYKQTRANNKMYTAEKSYIITVIDRDPDTPIPDKILSSFEKCKFDRVYKADGLYHYVFTLYY